MYMYKAKATFRDQISKIMCMKMYIFIKMVSRNQDFKAFLIAKYLNSDACLCKCSLICDTHLLCV